jgi:hypothetical protein
MILDRRLASAATLDPRSSKLAEEAAMAIADQIE